MVSVRWEIGGDFPEQHQRFIGMEYGSKQQEERFGSVGWVLNFA
jgi:hypothetical protein